VCSINSVSTKPSSQIQRHRLSCQAIRGVLQGRGNSSTGKGLGEAGLYVQALGGLLQEMRGRRGRGSPGGHTQQLSPLLHLGSAPEHLQRVERMEVPLAAAPSILRQLDSAPAPLDPGPWPRLQHASAAATEREYWAGVRLQPAFPTPLVKVSKQQREQQQEAALGHRTSPASAAGGSAEVLHARPGSYVSGGTEGSAPQHSELGLVQVPQDAGHITCMRGACLQPVWVHCPCLQCVPQHPASTQSAPCGGKC
jgi:hypothetical protein